MDTTEYIGSWMYKDNGPSYERVMFDLSAIKADPHEFDFSFVHALNKASKILGLEISDIETRLAIRSL